jgi:hypothetical protein
MLLAATLVLVAVVGGLVRSGLPADYVLAAVVPLVAYSAPLVLVLAAKIDREPGRPSAGDLDRLLDLKRADSLPPARRAPPRPARLPTATRPAGTIGGTDDDLDRLVQRKRWLAGGPAAPRED